MWNPTRGRISLSAFLYLAMVCFVSPKEPTEKPQQHQQQQRKQLQQQTSRPPKDPTSVVGPAGRRLYIRDGNGSGTDNNPCATTKTTGCDGSIAALSPPHTPTSRGWNTFRGSPGVAGSRDDGTASPASVSASPKILPTVLGYFSSGSRQQTTAFAV